MNEKLDTENVKYYGLYSTLHSLILNWIEHKKIYFSGRLDTKSIDDLDPYLLKMFGFPVKPGMSINDLDSLIHEFDQKYSVEDVLWLCSEHAVTLFLAKAAKAGINIGIFL